MTTNKRNTKPEHAKELYDAVNALAGNIQRIESDILEMRRVIMAIEHKVYSK